MPGTQDGTGEGSQGNTVVTINEVVVLKYNNLFANRRARSLPVIARCLAAGWRLHSDARHLCGEEERERSDWLAQQWPPVQPGGVDVSPLQAPGAAHRVRPEQAVLTTGDHCATGMWCDHNHSNAFIN